MGRTGFYVEGERCIACKACQVACKDHNNLETGIFFRNVFTYREPDNGNLSLNNYSGACFHCENPGCTAVCPTGAIYQNADKTVGCDGGKCIACGSCIWSCPYGAPAFSQNGGITQKCDSCAALRAEGKNPVCVDACLTHCIHFGDLDELEKQYGKTGMGPFAGREPDNTLFPKINERRAALRDSAETFLILGAGIAGIQAAAAIRGRNRSCRIILAERENCLPYSRPMLTKAPLKGFIHERHLIHEASWYGRQRIELRLGCRVTALDAQAKTVTLEPGGVLHYDKCIYALGADCFVPPIPGSDKERIVTIRRPADIEKIRRMGLAARRAVIIGGGVIGVECAWELKKAGLDVTLIEMADTLMERLLDRQNAGRLETALQDAGIVLVTAARITGIEGGRCAQAVVLESGDVFPADFVVVSAGIRANTGLAKLAGIETERSVIVNEHMETGIEAVYACGDCAQYHGYNSGTWEESKTQGETAGANAAGDAVVWRLAPAPLMLHTGSISLFAIGDVGKNPKASYLVYRTEKKSDTGEILINRRPGGNRCYETYYISGNRLTGAVLMGDLTKMRLVKECLNDQTLLPELLGDLYPGRTEITTIEAREG